MKKLSKIITAAFLCILVALSVSTEMIGTSEKYAANRTYMTSQNLAENAVTKTKLNDGNIHTTYRFKSKNSGEVTVDLGEEKEINSVILKEKGLNVKAFSISVSLDKTSFSTIYESDKIEYHRLCTFKTVTARYVKLTITKSDLTPKIRELEIYNEKPRANENFRVVTYSTISGEIYEIIDDVTLSETEKYEKIKQTIDADYYDTVTDYVQIGCVSHDENGNVFCSSWGSSEKQNKEKYYSIMTSVLHSVLDEKGVNITATVFNPSSGKERTEMVMKAITQNKDAFITNLIVFANKYKLDGIDLDWEFPISQNEFDAYNAFLQELKPRMKKEMWNGEQATLTLALGTWALKYTPETIDCVDYVNVMGYDILDQDGQHSSFFSSCVQAADYIESQGFPKEKINIGFPFYGTCTIKNMEQYAYRDIKYGEINKYENTYTLPHYETNEPRTVYFNSQSIIRDKTAYAALNGYGGVMIFSQYCDLPSDNPKSLTFAIEEYLKEIKND